MSKKPLIRRIFSKSTHRRVPVDPLQKVNSKENVQRRERARRALYSAFQGIRTGSASNGFATTSSTHQTSQGKESRKSPSLTHLNSSGDAHMVNVGHKKESQRSATAVCHLMFSKSLTYEALIDATLQKGDAIAVARIAGIQAAKKTSDLIPLAHPGLGITSISIDIEPFPGRRLLEDKSKHSDASTSTERSIPTSSSSPEQPHSSPVEAPQFSSSPLNIKSPDVPVKSMHGGVRVTATVNCYGKTGVEMEALTAANVTALTMYDMLKAIDKAMLISGSRVIEKRGGKSGSWRWNSHKKRIEPFNDSDSNSNPSNLEPNPSHISSSSSPSQSIPSTLNLDPNSSSFDDDETDPTSDPDPDLDANSLLQAEWTTLQESFTPTPDQEQTWTPPTPIRRDQLSGNAISRPDAAGFLRARQDRYDTWKKSH